MKMTESRARCTIAFFEGKFEAENFKPVSSWLILQYLYFCEQNFADQENFFFKGLISNACHNIIIMIQVLFYIFLPKYTVRFLLLSCVG